MKKKFKDTKVFKVIKQIAPDVLDTVTDIGASIYPPLGIVNNLVDVALGKANSTDKGLLKSAKLDYDLEYKDYLEDVQDARQMYRDNGQGKADEIADSVIKFNLWIILGLVAVMTLVIIYVDGKVSAVISGLIGTAVGNLFQERNTVIGFFFGSSQGSKDKDKK